MVAAPFFELHTVHHSHEPYVRNATATVEKMPNNELLAAWSASRRGAAIPGTETTIGEALGQGYVLCASSRDNGATWSAPRIIDDRADGCPSLLVTGGKVLINYDVIEYAPRQDNATGFDQVRFKGSVWVQRVSLDSGYTWSGRRLIDTGHGYPASASNGIRLRNGVLIWPYNWVLNVDRGEQPTESEQLCVSSVMRSADDGLTWERGGDVNPETTVDISEPAVVELSNGNLFMLMRSTAGFLYQSASHDDGDTWSSPAPSPLVSPPTRAALYRLSFEPSKILVVWNNSSSKRYPLDAAISYDDCRTWRHARTIVNPGRAVAYPNLTKATDGSMVVIWDEAPDLAKVRIPYRRHIMAARFSEEWVRS